MPRAPRDIQPGGAYHLISRFVDREWFIKLEHEREHYLTLLGRAVQKSDWRLMAYGIMSNHIHLAAVAGHHTLDSWIRAVHSPFADTMNRAYGRIGGMFVRGPKSYLVEPNAVGYLIAYIHNNPVRAGLCEVAAGSSWTSHRAYIGTVGCPAWLHVEDGMHRSGFADRNAFDAWINDPTRSTVEEQFTEEANESQLERERAIASPAIIPTDESGPARIVEATASIVGVSVTQLCSPARSAAEVLGRAVAVHAAAQLGIPGQRIASALRISQQRASVLRRLVASPEQLALCGRVVEVIGDLVRTK